jgi:hypothetical protein
MFEKLFYNKLLNMKELKLFTVLLFLSCVLPFNSRTQVINNLIYMWSNALNSNTRTVVNDTKVDVNGNIYVYGEFNGTCDFNPFSGLDSRTAVGGYDIYLSKYDILGNYLWTVTFGGSGNENSADGGLEVDPSGSSLYLVGEFIGTVDFDPGVTIENKTSLGASDIFFCKYTTAGVYSFTKTIGGTGSDDVGEVKMHGAGIVLCGRFSGSVDFDPNAGISNFESNGIWDQYLLKLSANGIFTWLRQWDLHSDRENLEIRTDGLGNIYMFGEYFMTNTDIDPGVGTVLISNSNVMQGNLFYLKLNPSGNYVLSATYNIPTIEVSFFIDAGSNLHVALNSYGVINVGSISATTNGTSSGVLLKLSNNGTVLMSTLLDNTGDDYFGVVDKVTDNSFVFFYVLTHTSSGALGLSAGTHVVKYDLNHTYVFNETFSSQFPVILCADNGGGVVISGTFTSTANFDFNGTQNMTTSEFYVNMFVSRYDSYTTLPVEMVSFFANCSKDNMELNWQTASEHNSSHFVLERSVDGIEWEKLGEVAAAGNSTSTLNYSFVDTSMLARALSYYRLLQVDFDGVSETYGPIASNCEGTSAFELVIAPNPSAGEFSLKIDTKRSQEVGIKAYHTSGKEVANEIIYAAEGTSLNFLNMKDLASGVYTLHVQHKGGIISRKIVIL